MGHDDRDESVVIVERGGTGAQMAAFLVGLAVGAGAALLFAPQSGEETRAEIARRAKKARDAAAGFAGDLRERADDAYDTARTEVRRRVRDAKRGVEDAVDDVRIRVDAGREAGKAAARAAREELQRRLAEAKSARDGNDDA